MIFSSKSAVKFGYKFAYHFEFSPALSLGLMFSLANGFYLWTSFMGAGLQLYITPELTPPQEEKGE